MKEKPPTVISLQGRTLFKASVVEVHSGDDMVVMVDLGVDDLYKKQRVRLQGVDTPDAFKAGHDTEAGRIRDQVRRMVMVKDKMCWIELISHGRGGWKVVLFVGEGEEAINVNELLIGKGFVFERHAVKEAATCE